MILKNNVNIDYLCCHLISYDAQIYLLFLVLFFSIYTHKIKFNISHWSIIKKKKTLCRSDWSFQPYRALSHMLFDRSYRLTLSIFINLLLLRPSFCVAEQVLDPHSFSMLFSHLPRCLFSRSLANELNLNTATQVSICLRTAQNNKLAVAQNKCEHVHMNEMSATNLFSRQAQAEPSIPLEGPGPGVRDGGWETCQLLAVGVAECYWSPRLHHGRLPQEIIALLS